MSKQKQKNHMHRRNDFKRRPVTKQPGQRILIVTEGDSEKAYFDAVVARWGLRGVVPKNPPCTDPRTLLENAEKYAKEGDNPRSNLKNGYGYDAVWIVYDLEKPNAKDRRDWSKIVVNKVRDGKKYKKYRLAISDPSFEFWYILHFERTTKSFTGASEVEQHLRRHWHNYRKGAIQKSELDGILNNTSTAIENAKWVREQQENIDPPISMTDVDVLMTDIDNLWKDTQGKDGEIPSLYEMCFGQKTEK